MKRIYFLLAALLLSTFASWAQGLSFTIYPEESGNFGIYYSTYKAPSGSCVFVDWGNGSLQSYEKAETGSDPSKSITGTATVGKPIKIYCDYIDAIQINSRAKFIKCEPNNPQLQYIYYFFDNLSPQNLEALYMSLYNRNGKTGHGELHLSQTASIETASTNILKSNAFIPEGINWRVCSMKSYTGSSRTHWKLHKNECKKYLIPAITIQTPTTANITDLQLGIKQSAQLPWDISASKVRIDDGTSNHESVSVSTYTTYYNFLDNASKLTVKGTGTTGTIKIYGAMISDICTEQISALNLSNTSNMRYVDICNCSNLSKVDGLPQQTLLEEVYLYGNTTLKSIWVENATKLKILNASNCPALTFLYFNTTSLEKLNYSGCVSLPYSKITGISSATKLTKVDANNLGWDACTMDDLYAGLRNPAPSGAAIYVDYNIVYPTTDNDWEGSNKTIATNKGWKVWKIGNRNTRTELTGDGGGCSFTNIPDNNFFNALKALGYANGAVGNEIPTANLKSITILDVSNKNISDLTGIQDFEALTTLKCITNNLSVLDVSKNTALTKLDCTTNNLSVLDVSKNTALIYLYFSHNKVKSLNLSSNKALKELNANYNNLNTLDVSNNTALKHLDCYDNSLNTIDVSNNKALESLSCGGNALSVLDVSQNTKLTVLNCPSNTLTSLDIRNGNNANITFFKATDNPNLSCIYVGNKNASYLSKWQKDAGARFVTSEAECSGTIAYTNIPDANFLQALKALGHGTGAVGNKIPTANLSAITTLDVAAENIVDLTGIQDFVALTKLNIFLNPLVSIDVTKNRALKELNCDECGLTSLNVTENTALTVLECAENELSVLDVSKNTALITLNFGRNKVKSLDVSKNTKLTLLACGQNNLTVLDVFKNTALTNLDCPSNQLTNLDVSKNTALTRLACSGNMLTSLDVRNKNNTKITDFNALNNPNLSCICVDNKTASYLSGWIKDAGAKFVNNESECGVTVAYTNIPDANFLQALKDLGYGTGAVGNDIPTANLSGITSLTLTYKDISSLTGIKDFAALEILKCDGNNLTSLDVSKNMALTFLDCEQNQITILNVSGNTALRTLNCADNALTSMNLSKNVALEELICYENQIESIDVSKNTKLISLKCSSNLVPILDVSKNKDLTDIDCVDNDLKTLDVSKNTALKHLDCRYNKISVLDLSMNTKLTGLYCNDNELISLNVRNGNNANVTYFDATNNPNLSCIYVDDKTADLSFWEKDATATFVNNEAECGALTSVDDIKMQTISIYPNPTDGILNFDFSTQKIQNINISDVAGKKVFVKNNPNQKEEIDLSSFVSGIYIVTVQMHKENRSFKIIKQ